MANSCQSFTFLVNFDEKLDQCRIKHVGGLYIQKLPLTINAENLIKVNKIIKIALIM